MANAEEHDEYEVRIGAFNGPMDLLLYLVQKKEVPLEQISIAEIADQFLKWIDEYGSEDLSAAGDFLYMASRLMALKVQELLPAEERDETTDAEYNEDREQLMKEMLEYQRFKQVAIGLQELETKNFGTFSRGRLEKTESDEDSLADANIWQLFRAYQKSLKTKISDTVHHIELDYVTIQDRQQSISNYLAANGRALFEDLLDNDTHPIVAAVTFMAMLEMIKTDDIVFRQSELFGPIWIYRKKNNAEFTDEMAHETIFYSKDPEVKPGLVEAIRNQALARSKEHTVGDLAAVMREAVLWATRGINVTEEDLDSMLAGREDLSEVEENPFAEMLKADDILEAKSNDISVKENSEQKIEPENIDTAIVNATDKEQINSENTNEFSNENLLENEALTDSKESFENVNVKVANVKIAETLKECESLDIKSKPSENIAKLVEPELSKKNAQEPPTSESMSDEEFREFMRKAQEFYNNSNNDK